MRQQQKNYDIDDETIHQQETNVIITEETHNQQESSNNDSINANNTSNNNDDTWSITTCNKNELEHDQQSKDKTHNNNQPQAKEGLFRFWNKLKRRIVNNQSSTTIDPRNFSTSKKRSIMIQMMFAAIV